MTKLDILIVGGGVAGPALIYWLNKAVDASITLIERSPVPRTSGQAIDIRGPGVEVIRKMGLEEKIQSKHTTEEGFNFVDPNGNIKASFPSSGSTEQQSFTSEFEILRGDLTRILIDATEGDAKYVYDEYVKGIEELPDGKLRVEFANHLPKSTYDLVVAADGMISKTREIVFGKGPENNLFLKKLGEYLAYCSIPRIESDTQWARWCNAGKGRMMLLRPDREGGTRAFFGVTDGNPARFEKFDEAIFQGREEQMNLLRQEFADAGWQSDRILKGMETAEDFYYQIVAQVHMEKFVKGHFALLGDAGYCPSPISGMGTTLALVAAYILAGELSKSPGDVTKALEQYQSAVRPFIDEVQKLLPGLPQIMAPQSNAGVYILNTLYGIASSNIVMSLISKLSGVFSGKSWKLPEYENLK